MPAPALLAISHGTASPTGQAAVLALVDAVGVRLPDVTVRLGHVDVQQPDVSESLDALGSHQPAVIVPLLLSSGYHVRVDLPKQAAGRRVAISPALGPDSRLVEVLTERLAALNPDADDPIVLAAAGSSDDRANHECRLTATMLAERLGRDVTIGFLDAGEPRLGPAVESARTRGSRVYVASYLLAPGYFHDRAVGLADGCPVAMPLLDGGPPPPSLVDIVRDRYFGAVAQSTISVN